MPIFNRDGLVPVAASEGPVDVPSGDSSKEEDEEERGKGPDSGAGPAASAFPRVMMTRMKMSRSVGACP